MFSKPPFHTPKPPQASHLVTFGPQKTQLYTHNHPPHQENPTSNPIAQPYVKTRTHGDPHPRHRTACPDLSLSTILFPPLLLSVSTLVDEIAADSQ